MKKLNSKGFTLVELLAVIIILAIVVAITIPAVTSTITTSRKKAADTAAQIAANWIDEQYALLSVGVTPDTAFTGFCGNAGESCTTNNGLSKASTDDAGKALIKAAGMKEADIANITVKINSTTGKSCVSITAKSGGSYYITGEEEQTHTQGGC